MNDRDEPVHIIIERTTATTTDAYVEFMTLRDAENAIHRLHYAERIEQRPARLAGHQVEYELSSQAELLEALFPNAKNISWDGGLPGLMRDPRVPEDQDFANFKGIVLREDMEVLAKHAELSHVSLLPHIPVPSIKC